MSWHASCYFIINRTIATGRDHFVEKISKLRDTHTTVGLGVSGQGMDRRIEKLENEIKQLRETIQDYNQEIQEYKVKEKKLNELQAKVQVTDF